MRRLAAVVARRLAPVMLATVTVLATAAVPAHAEISTWWVDDDGTVGATDCSGSQEAFTSIQLAIELAGRNDTISICPGTYPGSLEITGRSKKGLSLVSVVPHAAIIRPVSKEESELILIRSNRASLDGLRFELAPAVGCGTSWAIDVEVATKAALRDLEIVGAQAWRPGPALPRQYCRYRGIKGNARELLTIDDVRISGVSVGIDVIGISVITDSQVTPSDEDVEEDDAACLGTGIRIQGNSWDDPAVVQNTTVTQGFADTTERSVRACHGINAFGRTHLDGNTVSGTRTGIETGSRTLVEHNTVDAKLWGIAFNGKGVARFNRVSGASDIGIRALGARARIHDNDARGNPGLDCSDTTEPRRSGWPENLGTANRWTDNRGDDADPVGLCTPAAS
jgi:hypothetical protein